MARKLVIELPDGSRQMLEQVPAEHELQLQEKLKKHPELLPLEDLGLVGPAVVVGRESALDSGRVDLVLLGNGGDLALVEFKTGRRIQTFASAWRNYSTTGLICGDDSRRLRDKSRPAVLQRRALPTRNSPAGDVAGRGAQQGVGSDSR